MAAEYSASPVQTIAAGASAIFSEAPVPCARGMIYHRDESGLFRLASPSLMRCAPRRCCCQGMPVAIYSASFGGNIAIPTGGTLGEISLAIAIDGEIDPSSTMLYTPAAVETPGNVSTHILVAVPWICRCASVSVRNTSAQPITLENANIVFEFEGISYNVGALN